MKQRLTSISIRPVKRQVCEQLSEGEVLSDVTLLTTCCLRPFVVWAISPYETRGIQKRPVIKLSEHRAKSRRELSKNMPASLSLRTLSQQFPCAHLALALLLPCHQVCYAERQQERMIERRRGVGMEIYYGTGTVGNNSRTSRKTSVN